MINKEHPKILIMIFQLYILVYTCSCQNIGDCIPDAAYRFYRSRCEEESSKRRGRHPQKVLTKRRHQRLLLVRIVQSCIYFSFYILYFISYLLILCKSLILVSSSACSDLQMEILVLSVFGIYQEVFIIQLLEYIIIHTCTCIYKHIHMNICIIHVPVPCTVAAGLLV